MPVIACLWLIIRGTHSTRQMGSCVPFALLSLPKMSAFLPQTCPYDTCTVSFNCAKQLTTNIMGNFYYLGVVSHHSLEEQIGINKCFIVFFLIDTLWLLTEFVPRCFLGWSGFQIVCLGSTMHTHENHQQNVMFSVFLYLWRWVSGLGSC